MEENYSGVKGEIQLVQDSESNHVMITGAIKGLSPGFHGIYVHIGTTCFDRVSYIILVLFSRKCINPRKQS
jgi:Cu/Zn superoxide dismutase